MMRRGDMAPEGDEMGKALLSCRGLKEVEIAHDDSPVNLCLHRSTFGGLVKLNLSRFAGEIQLFEDDRIKAVKRLSWRGEENRSDPDAVSLLAFVETFGLRNLEELNVSGTR